MSSDAIACDPEVQRYLEESSSLPATEAASGLCALMFEKHGERPAVNNVRALLGRGSNSDLQRVINTYWRDLADRVRRAPHQLAMPDAVSEKMNALWLSALEAAGQQFDAYKADIQTQVETARREQADAIAARQQSEDYVDHLRQSIREEQALAQAAHEQARVSEEARQSVERTLEEARQRLSEARQETETAREQAAAAVQVAEARAGDMVAKVEAHYDGLRRHLLEETARERDELKARHAEAMNKLQDERVRREQEEVRLRGIVSEQRQQILDLTRYRTEAEQRDARYEAQIAQQQQELERLQRHMERLTAALERLTLPAHAPDQPTTSPSMPMDQATMRMEMAMDAAYRELADEDGVVVLADWKLEAIERYQDVTGLDPHAGALFDRVLAEAEGRGGAGGRWLRRLPGKGAVA
ncbi:DNA-binding protein [Laribacter hongkongensis]|uniref:DNA-binding protein n=1 Tax=Laribacter hongkongensis TaxID=168471 RepID=UPI001EFCC8B5|nr:DNA-binding protein [Laribacter hongkongensis]MCG9060169.1 DNA-binding protein [Laribacter hongkongensis]MCG9084274.1 DNA-binding protein [Laribacter hongkongensis]MCG9087263.1 DNA-binding protein [Laribacter hongkongensis]